MKSNIHYYSEIYSSYSGVDYTNSIFCYGHFNVIHPGHLRYLEYARSLGERLVVVVQGDHELTHSGYKHIFSANDRALSLAKLDIIDEVIILDGKYHLFDFCSYIKPKQLVLGKEYETSHQSIVLKSINIIEKHDGKVIFHAGVVKYSSRDQYSNYNNLSKRKSDVFSDVLNKQKITTDEIIVSLNNISNSNILVIGDTILDEYIDCDAQGMSSEAPVIVVRELGSEQFVGGAAIVALHCQSLGANTTFISVTGDDDASKKIENELSFKNLNFHFIKDSSRQTTYKTRYVVDKQKLFRVSRLTDHLLSKKIESRIIKIISKYASKVNGIIVSDFVHGMITPNIIDYLIDISHRHEIKLFGDLQCSSQVGNVAKFQSFYLITPTEKEARIALNNQDAGIEEIANKLMDKTNTNNLLLKLGEAGFIAYENNHDRQHFPALSDSVIDVTGAGDSLLAMVASSISSGNSLMVSAALGACMSKIAVETVGNLPISSQQIHHLIKSIDL